MGSIIIKADGAFGIGAAGAFQVGPEGHPELCTCCGGGPPPPPTNGACCLPNGSCVDTTATACASAGGTFHGVGTTCAGTPCPISCCYSGGIPDPTLWYTGPGGGSWSINGSVTVNAFNCCGGHPLPWYSHVVPVSLSGTIAANTCLAGFSKVSQIFNTANVPRNLCSGSASPFPPNSIGTNVSFIVHATSTTFGASDNQYGTLGTPASCTQACNAIPCQGPFSTTPFPTDCGLGVSSGTFASAAVTIIVTGVKCCNDLSGNALL